MEKEIKNKEFKNPNMNVGAEMPAEQMQAMPNEPMMPQMPVMQQPMTPQMPAMQYPIMPNMPMMQQPMMSNMPMMQQPMMSNMPGWGDLQGMEYMPVQAPTCPYFMNMQCPIINGQGMGNMSPMIPQYQQPLYMMYPYMSPNR